MPSDFHSVSVRRSPARLDVNAPDTSNAQSSPVSSVATKFKTMPRPRGFTSSRMSTKPQRSSKSRGKLFGLPSLPDRTRLEVLGVIGRRDRRKLDPERDGQGTSLAVQPRSLVCDPPFGGAHVVGVGVEPDVVAPRPQRGDSSAARPHERI